MDLVKLPSWSAGNQEVIAFVRDVHNDYGHEYEYLESLEQMNAYDSNTGLKNRISYNRKIRQLDISPEQVGVVYCDLNGLKVINDTQGHAAGDRYISSFAHILTDYFRPLECYKIGGDEFIVITCGMSENLFIERTEAFISNINRMPIPIASVGVFYGVGINRCISEAEKNMYKNKTEFYKNHPAYKR